MARKSFADLRALIAKLRAPEGCPWDRAQTHRTLRPYMLEEAYEAIAAIDAGDSDALCDELGDVLLQVLLHAQIAADAGEFTLDDVIDNLTRKLIRRHPHVFGNAPNDPASIRQNWERIKAKEGNHKVYPFPPLIAARKLIETGLDPETINYPAPELVAGGMLLRAMKSVYDKGFDPEIALQRTLSYIKKQ